MKYGNLSLRYYLFSMSNLLAAFGGGLILGKGLRVIDISYLQHGSVLAFFIGTILGLVLLQFVPSKFSKSLSQSFSMCCAATSIALFYLFESSASYGKISGNAGLIFFSLLSIRFAFWFYSRVIRASNASGQQQSIAWVELGYYSGMILGLVIWKLLKIDIDLSTALIIDAFFQFGAGILDFKSNAMPPPVTSGTNECNSNTQQISLFIPSKGWFWRLSLTVVLLTIAVQAVIFNLSHHFSESVGTYILATFYFGVAAAAFVANKLKVLLHWDNNEANITFLNGQKINLLIISIIAAIFVMLAVMIINPNSSFSVSSNIYTSNFFVCIFSFVASFLYEIISLAILDRIGYEEIISHTSGMIMKTYGLMGLGAAISLWILGTTANDFSSSIIIICACFSCSLIGIFKRNPSNQDSAEIAL